MFAKDPEVVGVVGTSGDCAPVLLYLLLVAIALLAAAELLIMPSPSGGVGTAPIPDEGNSVIAAFF